MGPCTEKEKNSLEPMTSGTDHCCTLHVPTELQGTRPDGSWSWEIKMVIVANEHVSDGVASKFGR